MELILDDLNWTDRPTDIATYRAAIAAKNLRSSELQPNISHSYKKKKCIYH